MWQTVPETSFSKLVVLWKQKIKSISILLSCITLCTTHDEKNDNQLKDKVKLRTLWLFAVYIVLAFCWTNMYSECSFLTSSSMINLNLADLWNTSTTTTFIRSMQQRWIYCAKTTLIVQLYHCQLPCSCYTGEKTAAMWSGWNCWCSIETSMKRFCTQSSRVR